MGFKNYLKKKLKYVFGVALVAGLLSQLISPLLSASATEPRFNFLPGDYQILEGFNETKNETVWKNPVSGNAGDVFRGSVYYHNGVLDTTAINTRIKVNIPQSTTNKTAKITASISADNAATVTSTVVNGQLVGLDGLVVNLDQDADLEFVPGSAQWFPNAQGGMGTSTPFPGGQSGNEIVSANGVNIDGIAGCWEFAGFVTFAFKTKAKALPNIKIEKEVKNISRNEASFSKETTAKVGEITQFKVEVTNTGNTDIADAVLRDIDPTGLEFVSGSLEKTFDGTTTALSDTDAAIFFDGGLTLDNLAPTKSITFTFKTKVLDILNDGDVVINKAIVVAAGKTLESIAKVKIEEKKANIIKSKSAYNDTKKEAADVVAAGDLVTYTLTTKNTGEAPIDFVVSDNIEEVLQNAVIVSISDGGKVEGNTISWPSVCIKPGETVTRTFQVKIKDIGKEVCFKNVYGNEVVLCIKVKKVAPCLHIEKFVRNVTAGESNFVDSNEAKAGDTLEYLINFSNTGDGPADQVKFTDTLPPNTTYLAGTTRISRNKSTEQTLPDGITGSGITLDTIAAGESGYIKFRITTSDCLAANEILVNTAHLTDDNKTISDTAQTKIVAKAVAAPVDGKGGLPKTGSSAALSFVLTFMAGICVVYAKYAKIARSEESIIINSLLA